VRWHEGHNDTAAEIGQLTRTKESGGLAVWDTVTALGSRFRARAGTSVAARSHLVERTPARYVKNARQALAVDEKRWDFSPEIWRGHQMHQTLEQRWLPGTHSDLGGGHDDEGLANISFQWFVQEARALGLAFDPEVLTLHHHPRTRGKMHESMTLSYRVAEAIRFRRGKGAGSFSFPI